MGRMIGAILGAILAAWVAVLATSGIVAMARTFAIIGLIAVVVAIVVWLLARRRK
jgi:K+ transporter